MIRVLRVGTDQTGQYLDIQHDLRDAPLIINESRCNANTKTVITPREKLQDKLETVERVRFEETRCNTIQIHVLETSFLTQDGLDLAETAKHLAQQKREPHAFDFFSDETRSAISGWETQICIEIWKTETC